jgi:hypothetical protein
MLQYRYFNWCVKFIDPFCMGLILMCSNSEYPSFGIRMTCRSFLDLDLFTNENLSRESFFDFYFEN